MAPVTVFLVAVACLLATAAAVRPLALRTGVPEAVWLIGLGVVLRATGLVSTATIAALAPFFAAIALIMVLFEAGRDMVFGAAAEQVGRARKLALAGAALVVPTVALFSLALSGLELLPVWSWTHALMLGALMLCTAPEVFAPTLYRRAHPELVGALEREAALTGALAIAATACCIDLLSLQVPAGKAYAAIAAGFGLGLAFGAFAGLLWITAIRRIGPGRGVYPYTLAAILALYVVTDTLGGIGALAVLVFGAVVSNAGPLVAALFRPRGTIVEAADEDFRAALDDHARTVEITRVLLFTFIGLGLGPPWGLVAMGVVLGLMLVVLRLVAARLVLRQVDERTFSALALGWPRGMLVAGLAALPHAAAVPGTEALTTLVFSAVATTCAAFAVAISPLGYAHVAENMMRAQGPQGHGEKDMSEGASAGTAAPPTQAPTVAELLAAGSGEPGSGRGGTLLAGEPGSGRGGTLVAGEPAGSGRGGTLLAGEPGSGRGGTLIAGEPAASGRDRTLIAGEPGASVRGGTLIAREPVASGHGGTWGAGEPVTSGRDRTLIAGTPVASGDGGAHGGALIPGDPLSARGGALIPGEPEASGDGGRRGGTLIPGELLSARGGTLIPDEPGASVRGGTLIPSEPVASGDGGVRGGVEVPVAGTRTLVPGEPVPGLRGGTRIPGALDGDGFAEPVAGVSAKTLVPGEPVASPSAAGVSTRTLVPGESASPAGGSRFAPPGSRTTERTILRGSGPGTPEIVRHVLISRPAEGGATPATEPGLATREARAEKESLAPVVARSESGPAEALTGERAQSGAGVVQVPAGETAGLAPEGEPGSGQAVQGQVAASEAGAPAVPREPPLLELVNELLHGADAGHAGGEAEADEKEG